MYFYVKALHIIFVVTWFSGLFYIVRLFIYSAEAHLKPEPERSILLRQFGTMQHRLWYIITWPSAILTLVLGTWMGFLYGSLEPWLQVKLVFVALLFLYHLSLQKIFRQQQRGLFTWSSQQLRMWNELSTLLLFAIVMLAVVKQLLNAAWGFTALIGIAVLLMIGIKLYKKYRKE